MDHEKLNTLLERFVADMGATGSAGLTVIGNRLGLYAALAEGRATPEQFAGRTGYHLRYLTEWLRNQAAGGYISYDAATGEFFLTDEQAFCLADPNGPNFSAVFLIGFWSMKPTTCSRGGHPGQATRRNCVVRRLSRTAFQR